MMNRYNDEKLHLKEKLGRLKEKLGRSTKVSWLRNGWFEAWHADFSGMGEGWNIINIKLAEPEVGLTLLIYLTFMYKR